MKRTISTICVVLAFVLVGCGADAPSRTDALLAELNVHPERIQTVDGVKNLRDLGGYQTMDGRTVKWDMIYRSANLHELSPEGEAELSQLNIRAITDLRSDPEREQEPDNIPLVTPAIEYSVLPINDQPVDIEVLGRKIVKGEVDEVEIMALLDHRRFITNPAHRESWGRWLKSLGDDAHTPHLFHCTSGKDRAGYGAAIFLLTMGVPKETVKRDFLLSNAIYADYIDDTVSKIDRFVMKDVNFDLIRKVMGVSEETIDATFAQMEADFGSIDGFIEHGLGIDAATRAKLQAKFLEVTSEVSQ